VRAAVVLAAVLLGLSWGGACAADDSRKLLRPSPRVLMDPAAYYSPLLFTKKAEPKPGEWMAEHPVRRVTFTGELVEHSAGELSDDEVAAIEAHLRSLGYMA